MSSKGRIISVFWQHYAQVTSNAEGVLHVLSNLFYTNSYCLQAKIDQKK
jgi:hypothetical protein